MINQQGTLKKDTPETICIKSLNKNLTKSFRNWFIGFIEGNENVFIVNRRYARFELSCFLKNESLLYYIKNKLGFGSIRKLKFLDTVIVEFFVHDDNLINCLRLIDILNGNIRCVLKNKYFYIYYNKLKVKLKKNDLLHLLPVYIENLKPITLQSS